MTPLRIALAQTCFQPDSVWHALSEVERLAGEAAQQGADLMMLPETFLSGYGNPQHTRDLSISTTGSAFAALCHIANRHSLAILCGYPEAAGSATFNSAALVSKDGSLLLNYRKAHLWGSFEADTFTPGTAAPVFEIRPGLQAGVLICYDLDLVLPARHLARQGAGLLLVLSATTKPYEVVPEHVVPARAYENAAFVAFCNHASRANGLNFVGLSRVVGPDGSVISAARGRDPCMLVADIDLAAFASYVAAHQYGCDERSEIFPGSPPDSGCLKPEPATRATTRRAIR